VELEMKAKTKYQLDGNQSQFIEMPLMINTFDIDAARHVNNVVYIRWLEELRTKLISSICDFKRLIGNGYYIVVISTLIKYKKQLKLFDKPTGTLKIDSVNHGIITLGGEIKIGSQISAIAEQKCIVMDLKSSKMIQNELLHKLFGNGNLKHRNHPN
jgi:acyl-CoA thioester hydrolase